MAQVALLELRPQVALTESQAEQVLMEQPIWVVADRVVLVQLLAVLPVVQADQVL
jgi:hypothetical protein